MRKTRKTLTEEVEAHFRHAQKKGARKQKIVRWKQPLWRDKDGNGDLIE